MFVINGQMLDDETKQKVNAYIEKICTSLEALSNIFSTYATDSIIIQNGLSKEFTSFADSLKDKKYILFTLKDNNIPFELKKLLINGKLPNELDLDAKKKFSSFSKDLAKSVNDFFMKMATKLKDTEFEWQQLLKIQDVILNNFSSNAGEKDFSIVDQFIQELTKALETSTKQFSLSDKKDMLCELLKDYNFIEVSDKIRELNTNELGSISAQVEALLETYFFNMRNNIYNIQNKALHTIRQEYNQALERVKKELNNSSTVSLSEFKNLCITLRAKMQLYKNELTRTLILAFISRLCNTLNITIDLNNIALITPDGKINNDIIENINSSLDTLLTKYKDKVQIYNLNTNDISFMEKALDEIKQCLDNNMFNVQTIIIKHIDTIKKYMQNIDNLLTKNAKWKIDGFVNKLRIADKEQKLKSLTDELSRLDFQDIKNQSKKQEFIAAIDQLEENVKISYGISSLNSTDPNYYYSVALLLTINNIFNDYINSINLDDKDLKNAILAFIPKLVDTNKELNDSDYDTFISYLKKPTIETDPIEFKDKIKTSFKKFIDDIPNCLTKNERNGILPEFTKANNELKALATNIRYRGFKEIPQEFNHRVDVTNLENILNDNLNGIATQIKTSMRGIVDNGYLQTIDTEKENIYDGDEIDVTRFVKYCNRLWNRRGSYEYENALKNLEDHLHSIAESFPQLKNNPRYKAIQQSSITGSSFGERNAFRIERIEKLLKLFAEKTNLNMKNIIIDRYIKQLKLACEVEKSDKQLPRPNLFLIINGIKDFSRKIKDNITNDKTIMLQNPLITKLSTLANKIHDEDTINKLQHITFGLYGPNLEEYMNVLDDFLVRYTKAITIKNGSKQIPSQDQLRSLMIKFDNINNITNETDYRERMKLIEKNVLNKCTTYLDYFKYDYVSLIKLLDELTKDLGFKFFNATEIYNLLGKNNARANIELNTRIKIFLEILIDKIKDMKVPMPLKSLVSDLIIEIKKLEKVQIGGETSLEERTKNVMQSKVAELGSDISEIKPQDVEERIRNILDKKRELEIKTLLLKAYPLAKGFKVTVLTPEYIKGITYKETKEQLIKLIDDIYMTLYTAMVIPNWQTSELKDEFETIHTAKNVYIDRLANRDIDYFSSKDNQNAFLKDISTFADVCDTFIKKHKLNRKIKPKKGKTKIPLKSILKTGALVVAGVGAVAGIVYVSNNPELLNKLPKFGDNKPENTQTQTVEDTPVADSGLVQNNEIEINDTMRGYDDYDRISVYIEKIKDGTATDSDLQTLYNTLYRLLVSEQGTFYLNQFDINVLCQLYADLDGISDIVNDYFTEHFGVSIYDFIQKLREDFINSRGIDVVITSSGVYTVEYDKPYTI